MDLEQIEQQRQQLETHVAKLRSSLKHWQTWDAEYEGLKEDLHLLDRNPDHAALTELSKSYHGSVVDEKEIDDLTGLSSGATRTRQQIIDLIDHRLAYVTKNIDSLSRQYYTAEGKLEEFDFASALATNADPRFAGEQAPGDSPLIEIHEELDEDDNVITSELRRPDLETQKVLQKIASQRQQPGRSVAQTVNDASSSSLQATDHATQTRSNDETPRNDAPAQRPPVRKKSVSFSADTKAAEQSAVPEGADGKKSVSFAPKVAVAPAAGPADSRSVSFANDVEEIPPAPIEPQTPTRHDNKADAELQQQLRSYFKPGDTVYELNDDEEPVKRHIVLPENESPQDAEMRRQMLNYHLNEVGSVVAAMELEDGDGYNDDHSDFTNSENFDELDTPYTTGTSDNDDEYADDNDNDGESEDEDEDDFGRLRGSGITDQYRARMNALSARLSGSHQASGTSTAEDTSKSHAHTLTIRNRRSSNSSTGSTSGELKDRQISKKRVSFAEALDVAANDAPPLKAQKAMAHSPNPVRSSDDVDMHAPLTSSMAEASFPSDQDDRPDEDRESGPIVSETLVERTAKQAPALPPSTEDADLLMSKRELTSEYYRKRNELIREQGGFTTPSGNVDDDNDDVDQLYEERDGRLKKVSRFKAARLGQ